MFRIEAGESIDFQDFLDGVTEDELRRHTDITTDGDKISNIWGILGLKTEAELARMLGIKQRQISKIFEKGIVDKSKQRRLDRTYACASIFERNFPDISERERQLQRPHPFLRHKSPIESLKQGHVDQVLYFSSQLPLI